MNDLLIPRVGTPRASRPTRPSLPPADRYPADLEDAVRPGPAGPHDRLTAPQVLQLILTVADWDSRSQSQRTDATKGTEALLGFMTTFSGEGWQERWHATGADHDYGVLSGVDTQPWTSSPKVGRSMLLAGLSTLILADVIRPSFKLLRDYSPQALYRRVRQVRCPELFMRAEQNGIDLHVPAAQRSIALSVLCILVVHSGRNLDELLPEDFLAIYRSHRSRSENKPPPGVSIAWDLARGIATIPDIPFKMAKARGQQTAEKLVDRYPLACREIRDVIVRYLQERRPNLDYGSFENLARTLARFWLDIERLRPGITTLQLPEDTAREWKASVQTITNADGTTRPRLDQLGVFVPVRAFYLDIAHWALEDPSWVQWAVPCPISPSDTDGYAKNKQRVTARMHQRIRERLPRVQDLADAADDRRRLMAALYQRALQTHADGFFDYQGQRYRRVAKLRRREPPTGAVRRNRHPVVIIEDLTTGTKIDLTRAEDEAFWSWAIIETLRHTGVRVEELSEITHLALVNYRTPDTGEQVPLLQIVPSKSNQERVLLVTPELASVLATIIARHREDNTDMVPATRRLDPYERELSAALPYLFQRRRSHRYSVITAAGVNKLLNLALVQSGIVGIDGQPLHTTAHDFRRIFATETVTGGLPIHIAARLLGHASITTTQAYLAVFQDDLIRAYRRHLEHRRTQRPAEEYREPTPEEWEEFDQHFAKRQLELGTCGRPYGTPCKHEHACIRCPMLRIDPRARHRLEAIIANLGERIAEAKINHWLGETDGLNEPHWV